MARQTRTLPRMFVLLAAGSCLLYGGITSFSANDPVPALLLEGIVVALGCILLYQAVKTLARREEETETPLAFQSLREVRIEPAERSFAASAPEFVERRRGGDRRSTERRQTIAWAMKDSRFGPGRRRSNGRRASDRMPGRYSFGA